MDDYTKGQLFRKVFPTVIGWCFDDYLDHVIVEFDIKDVVSFRRGAQGKAMDGKGKVAAG